MIDLRRFVCTRDKAMKGLEFALGVIQRQSDGSTACGVTDDRFGFGGDGSPNSSLVWVLWLTWCVMSGMDTSR